MYVSITIGTQKSKYLTVENITLWHLLWKWHIHTYTHTTSAISFQSVSYPKEKRKERKKNNRKIVSFIGALEIRTITQWKCTPRTCVLMIKPECDTHAHILGINTLHQTHHKTVSNKVQLLFLINVAQKIENVFAHISSGFNGIRKIFISFSLPLAHRNFRCIIKHNIT